MTDLSFDNHTYFEGNDHLINHLQENYSDYATLIRQEATKIAKETLDRGGGVIEYQVPNSLLDHIIQKGINNFDKSAIQTLFSEQVEQKAFDLLIHNRHQFYRW